MKNILSGIVLAAMMASCAAVKNETAISPYSASQPVGPSALVYALPQTRLYFEVELVKTLIRKGPYAEYAGRMLGLQNVPMKDAESWQIRSIRISDRQEADSKQLYTVSFTDYPQNMDRLLRFTGGGLLLDATVGNVVINSRSQGKNSDDFQFVNTAVRNTTVEKVDTLYKTILTDTAFVRIPVLQRKVMGKTAEEQAREAAQQIFNIRQSRLDVLTGNTDYHPEGAALKLVLQSLDTQEEQLLSLFNGAKIENRQTVTWPALPEKPSVSADLFYFSERTGIVSKNTAGAKAVWYEIGKAVVPASITPDQQAKNIIYYRIPQLVEISAGVDKTTLVREQVTVCQFGNIVSFPLVAPK
ncbi:MAG: DUF4831 family protein [Bacteroidales bacterium]|jgi:hypothetical protein|nr:DUF4831 family protein [Bacteroidales bacterium]